MGWQAATEAEDAGQAVTETEAATGAEDAEQAAREMENAQKVADEYDAREAHWTAAVYEANERGVRDMNYANEAQQMANEQEAIEVAERVADEFEAREKHWRREKEARAALGIRAEAEGYMYVVSKEQVRMEIAAIEVQERGDAMLVRARARNQASADAQLAQKMAEEYAYEVEDL